MRMNADGARMECPDEQKRLVWGTRRDHPKTTPHNPWPN